MRPNAKPSGAKLQVCSLIMGWTCEGPLPCPEDSVIYFCAATTTAARRVLARLTTSGFLAGEKVGHDPAQLKTFNLKASTFHLVPWLVASWPPGHHTVNLQHSEYGRFYCKMAPAKMANLGLQKK